MSIITQENKGLEPAEKGAGKIAQLDADTQLVALWLPGSG